MTPRATDHRRWIGSLVAILGIGVLLAACKDDGKPATTTSSSTTETTGTTTTADTTTTSVTTPADPGAEAVARYETFWQVRFEANQAPVNPGDPRLADYASGPQLENVVQETTQRRDQGLALRRAEPSSTIRRIRNVKVDGDTATFQDCATDSDVVYRVATGEVVNDGVGTYSVLATMKRVGGVWKLDRADVVQRWKGVMGCALSEEYKR